MRKLTRSSYTLLKDFEAGPVLRKICRFCQMETSESDDCFEAESCLSDSGFGELICKYKLVYSRLGFLSFWEEVSDVRSVTMYRARKLFTDKPGSKRKT